MNELLAFIDSHPEVRPFATAGLLKLFAETPGLAEAMISFFKNLSDALREKLAAQFEEQFAAQRCEREAEEG